MEEYRKAAARATQAKVRLTRPLVRLGFFGSKDEDLAQLSLARYSAHQPGQ